MRKDRLIIYVAVVLLLALLYLLGWNARKLFRFEKEQLQAKVEFSVTCAADSIQNYNGGLLSNQAKMFMDPRYSDKLNFAAGFTHNMGKLSVALYEDTTPVANAPVKDTVHPENDSLPVFTSRYIRTHVKYKPEAVMGIRQFDSVFRQQLVKNDAVIHFSIQKVIPFVAGHTKKVSGDSLTSPLFILDFTEPIMYSVHYVIPPGTVYRRMYPFLLSTVFLCMMLVAGFAFFYHSTRSRHQQYQFRQTLFGNITHELKTPLTSMQLIVDNAKKQLPAGDLVSIPAQHVSFAENELNRMKLIVDKILSFTKMSSEQFTFNTERVDLGNIVMEAIAIMKINTQQAKGIINYEQGAKVAILGDPVLLVNAISAIIDNALKYTGKPPEINIRLTAEGHQATIAISDNGIGIPQQLSKKVFEPFFRVPTGSVYNTSGHGLGLSFVKQVMKLHGGSIHFTSNDQGTTFHLKFRML